MALVCESCGATESTQMVSVASLCGKRYIFRVHALPLPVGGAFPLCQECYWARAVFESQCEGFDVHTHHPALIICPFNCLTKLGGREVQVQLFDALAHDASALYRMIKRWDRLAGPGTAAIHGVRTRTFYDLRIRQLFYESLTSAEKVREVMSYRQTPESAFVPQWAAPGVLLTFRVFKSAWTAPGGDLQLPGAHDEDLGLHAVALWDIDDDGSIAFINSWGAGWGAQGLGRMSSDYLDRFWVDAWLVRNAGVGASPYSAHRIAAATTDSELRRAWMLPNPASKSCSHAAPRSLRFVSYATASMESSCRVDVIEVRSGYGMRLGWAHVFHPAGGGGAAASEIRELFVWPAYRRCGLGSLLEERACSAAGAAESTAVRVQFHEADAHIKSRAAGRLFGKSKGYEWKHRRCDHPRLHATGQKDL